MEPTVHAPKSETASVWTDEMHVHFLNTMETSFVRTMLNRTYGYGGSTHRLRLDRQLPDTSESTLDSKPRNRHKKHAPSDSMGPRTRMATRRMRRKSFQLHNSSSDQEVPQLENGREGASCVAGDDDNLEQISTRLG